jgi:hypothetical protein
MDVVGTRVETKTPRRKIFWSSGGSWHEWKIMRLRHEGEEIMDQMLEVGKRGAKKDSHISFLFPIG